MKKERQFTEQDKEVFDWHSEGNGDWHYALGGTICLYDGRTGNNLHLVKATINEQCEIEEEEPPQWVSVDDRLPEEEGLYLIFSPSLDKKKPFRWCSWYEPKEKNWGGIIPVWAKAITHWMELPDNPPRK